MSFRLGNEYRNLKVVSAENECSSKKSTYKQPVLAMSREEVKEWNHPRRKDKRRPRCTGGQTDNAASDHNFELKHRLILRHLVQDQQLSVYLI